MNLHDAIMKIQCPWNSREFLEGHKSARRAAAELASAFEKRDPAPELLAAMVALLNAATANSCSTDEEREAVIEQARAAIAKATE